MKHAFLILIVAIIIYVAWQFTASKKRRKVIEFLKRHGVRFLIALTVLFGLFFLAVQHPSIQLF